MQASMIDFYLTVIEFNLDCSAKLDHLTYKAVDRLRYIIDFI
jgi:hypothetical protein